MTVEKLIQKLNNVTDKLEDEQTDIKKSLEYYHQCIELAQECLTALNTHKGEFKVLNDNLENLNND